tara:strand:+ start:1278 stop:1436 length:159 start_codon:yes stop_codon:yes gene_type:complete
MPITKKKDGWYWGSRGPYASLKKAEEVAAAANTAGYKGKKSKTTQKPKKRVG